MQRFSALALGIALALLSSSTVFAGGFAVTTLDSVPTTFAPGETYSIGFMLRQHGVTPVRDAAPTLLVWRGQERLSVAARAEGEPGHYVAAVTFPDTGEWTWAMDQAPFPQIQSLGTVSVTAPPMALGIALLR